MNINFIIRITDNSTSADIISIYLIDDNADSFYAEFNDFDEDKCSKVIIRSIVENLKFEGDEYFDNKDFKFKSDKETISELLKNWLRRYDIIDEFIGDKTGFGWYNFLQLIG